MNFNELSTYNLADAVKFHNRLNPRLWGRDEHLLPEVRDKLLEIAADFQEFLGVEDLDVVDITISGSNAAYSYTPHSDIDLHLVVRAPEGADDVYQELFNAKKYQYNDEHDIRIHGADVELYVQPADESPVSLGEYSVRDSKWLQVPRRKRATIDQSVVKHKYEDLRARIESAVKDSDATRISSLITKIKNMRQTGLDKHGEFGPENIAYKILRTQGLIQKLYDARNAARDRELSLTEKKKNKSKKKFKYGSFGGWWFPGYNFNAGETGDVSGEGGESVHEDNTGMSQGSAIGDAGAQSTWDGVSPDTDEFLSEDDVNQSVLRDFIRYTAGQIGLRTMPKIHIHNDAEWSEREKSFGRFEPETGDLHINMWNRHIMDVLRTTAHELAHARQHEVETLGPDAGDTGSDMENEAHAVAGIIMRRWAKLNPSMFESSGYIPTEKEKNDPRFVMALSPDVRPGATGLNANKMNLKTDSQGKPALLMKTVNLREGRMPQPSQGPGKYRDLNQPLGPETPPTMPAGTVRVDVSDVYDWYKLGQHISNMKGLGKHDFGKGPPSAIISFGDEDTEHKYIQDLEKTGLTTTDIDPVDPNQPAGMKRQKTDPTYNVDEDIVESLRQEFALLEDEYISEVRMSTANLRQLAAKTGAQAGMEFEMIVPNVGEIDREPEYERDEGPDRRARSFDDIEQFFYDGDYNGRGDIRRLMEALNEAYMDWKMNQTSDDWIDEGLDYVRDYVANNDLFDREEALDTARDEIIDANPDLPTDSEDFQQLVNARINELEEQFVQDEFDAQGRIYNDAFEQFSDEKNDDYDEADFLRETSPYMSDVETEYDIQWPYWYDANEGNDDNLDIDQVADDFSNSIGKPVNASRSYHGARREPGHYVVEPDGSLEGDNPGDSGLEFVSPPMPIDELLSDLNKVKAWAGREGCYTNDSTGLHINISVPDYSLQKLDYVKLALLMGDEYVLELFGRSGNHYAKAATGKIRDALKRNPDLAPQLMDKMRGHMEDLATKAIHSGTTDKYTSINTKTGYIEFRSPGGDWLDENFDKIENTLLRFTVALSAAIDPEAYRKEYLKKLYKLLEGSQSKEGVDVVQLFANYSSGELDKSGLISQVRQTQLQRKLKKGDMGGEYWWVVSNPGNSYASVEVVARTREEAIEKALEPGGYPSWKNTRATVVAKPLRPFDSSPIKARAGAAQAVGQQGNWGIWLTGENRFSRAPGQPDNSVLRRFPSREAAEQWIEQTRATNPALRPDIEVREIEPAQQQVTWNDFNNLSQTDYENRLGWPDQTGDANYEIVDRRTGRRQMVFIANTDQDANRKYTQWLDVAMLPHDTEDYGYREIVVPGSTVDLQRQRAARAQEIPEVPLDIEIAQQSEYELYRISDGRAVTAPAGNPIVFRATSPEDAERKIPRYAADFNLGAPELFAVRSVLQVPAQAPRTLTTPGQGQQVFTGNWLIQDPNGRTLHRFGGIGNNQGDANNFAIRWLQQNPRYMQAGVEVVPEMG